MTDYIDRQAAIDRINKQREHLKPDVYPQDKIGDAAYRICAEFIERLPSVQPQRWISVSEALPNDGVEVWVTIKGHDVIRCEEGETLEQAIDRINKIRWVTRGYWSDEEHAWNDPSFGCPLIVKPIAWMPINTPEPWRG